MTSQHRKISDEEVESLVIDPAGGLSMFRILVCPGFKLIEYFADGEFMDLIIEDEGLASATVAYLERRGVPEVLRQP